MAHQNTAELIQLALNSNLMVDALEPISALKKKCARLGINGNFDYPLPNDEEVSMECHGEYEVESILDHHTEKHLYLIKWKGYGTEFNTWEPSDHLGNVSNLTYNFRLMERSLSEDNKAAYKQLVLLSCLLNELVSPDNSDPFILLQLNGQNANDEMEYQQEHFRVLKDQLKVKSAFVQTIITNDVTFQLNYFVELDKAMRDTGVSEAFQSVENLNDVIFLRKKFVKSIKICEARINRLILEQEGGAFIEIQNNLDLEAPFEDFSFIEKSIAGTNVNINEEPLLYCVCDSCDIQLGTCCLNVYVSSLGYTKRNSLKGTKGMRIFECNSMCHCPPTCPNRVIQNGRKFQLGVYKTFNGRGWGVKALEPIPKGKFIVEYVGEIITQSEAEHRALSGQNSSERSYLFDMECDIGANCDYVLDATKFGNFSRYINHSCSPNMEVYPFWIGNPDMQMPRFAFFSQKSIANGEELTFDYRMSAPTYPENTEIVRVPCKCGSRRCRKFLF